MTLYFTLTDEDRVLAIHQTLTEARTFAASWNRGSKFTATRQAERVVTAERDSKCIYARSDRFKVKMATGEFTL